MMILNLSTISSNIKTVNAYDYVAYGIDVSVHQASIDWNTVANNGISFAIIRSGLGKYTNQEDKNFKTNYNNAKAAGLNVGTYWVSYAMSVDEAYEEAEVCYSIIKGYSFDYPVYYDMEVASQSKSLSKQQITNIGLAFCQRLASYGYTVGIYANKNWFTNYIDKNQVINNGYEIWLAQYPSGDYAVNPDGYDKSADCGIWQYSSKGEVAGISGYVDVNVSYKNYGGSKPSSMTISGETKPEGNLQPGKFFAIKGNISSSLNITSVWGGVYYDDWTVTSQYAEATPNSTTYDLSTYFDNKIIFNRLEEGSYHYLIKAKDTSGNEYTLVSSDFNIGNPAKWYEKLPAATFGESFDAIILNKNYWRPIRPDSSSNVVLHTEQGAIIEMWRFTRQSDGSYTIENYGNGLFLDAYGMGTEEGTNICVHEGNDSAAQRWFLYEANGGFVFRPAYGELAMDLCANKSDDDTNIELWTYHGGDAQIFSIYTSGVNDYAKPKPNKISLTVKDHTSIALSWEPSYYVDKYIVYRSTDNSNWQKIGETTTPNYSDTGLSAGTQYYYKFEAQNRFYKESSESVSAKTNELPATTTTTTTTVTTTIKTTTTVKSTTTTVATSEKELELSEKEVYIKVGEKYTIKANQDNLTYTSSDESIAIASNKGVITGIKNGQAVITVINESKDTDSITVNIIVPKYGDANGDNDISIADAVIIMQSLANPDMYGLKGKSESHITDIGYINADCYNTGDGVTNADALAIQKYKLSLITALPENT
jgi:GH25 family lysozyme M1 (1,4-beta-N-acetylmuramidase)